MQSSLQYLVSYESDEKRLQDDLGGDRRIRYGWNTKTLRLEAWYVPDNSRPYMICHAVNVCHAEKLLRARMEHDKKRAKDLLADIDEHNEQLIENMHGDAMHAVKSDLRNIASGRKFYT